MAKIQNQQYLHKGEKAKIMKKDWEIPKGRVTRCCREKFIIDNFVLASKAFKDFDQFFYRSLYEMNDYAIEITKKAIKEKGYNANDLPALASRLRWVWQEVNKNIFKKAIKFLEDRENKIHENSELK